MKFSLPATLLAFVAVTYAIPIGPNSGVLRRQNIDEQICKLKQTQCEQDGAAFQKAVDDNFQKFEQANFAAPKSNPVLQKGDKFETNGKSFDSVEEALVQSCTDQKDACKKIGETSDNGPFDNVPSFEQCDLQETFCLAQDPSGRALNFKNPTACKVNFDACVKRGGN